MRPRRPWDPYWMLAPTALLLGLFFLYPIALAAKESLYAWDLLTPPRYVGLDNYGALWQSGEALSSLRVTLTYSVLVVAGAMTAGLGLAILLNRPGRLFALTRSAIFSAYVVSWVAVGLLFMWILDADMGIVSRGSRALGLGSIRFLGDPRWALSALAAVAVWKITGYAMVLFLAGLSDIPPSLGEAAALDGAGNWARLVHVTWPMLRPTAGFVAITSFIASFQAFDIVRVMTQGGPVHATRLFVYAIYEQIFMNLRVGRASAQVVILFAFLLVLTLIGVRAFRPRWRA